MSRLPVTVAFFGYVRQGTTVILVVALLAVLGPPPSGDAAEGGRWAAGLEVAIDGGPVLGTDPAPVDEHAPRRVEVRHAV